LDVIAATNKIDPLGFSEQFFEDIKADYTVLVSDLGIKDVHYVPLPALLSDYSYP